MIVAATDLSQIGVFCSSCLLLENVGTEAGGGEGRLAAGRDGDLCFFGSGGRMLSLLRCGPGFVDEGPSAPISLCAVS